MQKINFKIKALNESFGACIEGVDLKSVTQEKALLLKKLLYQKKILVLKDIKISPPEYLCFAKLFGEPVPFFDKEYQHPEYPEIFVVSNIFKEGKNMGKDRVGYYWHSDSSFMPKPLPLTMLHSQIVPKEGGETAFIDMADAYKKLQQILPPEFDAMQAKHESKWRYLITENDIGLSVEEILIRDEALVPSQVHPTVVKHPKTAESALYLSQGITKRIIDLSEIESAELIEKMWYKIENEAAQYKHSWQSDELVIWDNRSVVHRAFPAVKRQSRMMFRIGIDDGCFFGG